jgi:hypothetical protein
MIAGIANSLKSGAIVTIFYRGITLDPAIADVDKSVIRETGTLNAKAMWSRNTRSSPHEVRRQTPHLSSTPSKAREAIRALPQEPMTYACASFEDAAFYAKRGAGLPVVIAVEVPLENVAIDGKDFLYTVFQLWDRGGRRDHKPEVRYILDKLFGPALAKWFDQAAAESEQAARIGLCDLAADDLAAISAHYLNKIAIAGRYGTLFCSAFDLPAKVDSADILMVEDVVRTFSVPKRVVNLQTLIPG